jgi:hypothetical protein
MSLKLVRKFGAPRRFSAKTGCRPTIMVRGRSGPVALRAVTLRGLPVTPHSPNTVTVDVAAGVNALRLLLDPFYPNEAIEVCEQNGETVQVLHCHIFDPQDPVSGYRIFGE